MSEHQPSFPAPPDTPRRELKIPRNGPEAPSTIQKTGSIPSRKRSWLPRKLRITREGKYFIAITFGVGFAAINTGNNLLYLLLGMLLSLIIVSSVMSEISLRHLTVVRRLPQRAQVNRFHLVEVEVRNLKRRFPSYAIEIEDLREGQPADKRCFFLKISPGSAQVAAYRRTPARRGRDRHIGFRIATRFPFGFFEKSREVSAEDDLVIYPAVDPVMLPPQSTGNQKAGDTHLDRGLGFDILSVRPMREGDEARDIYWRKSTNQMIVKERARETRRDVTLVLDNRAQSNPPSEQWLDQFEQRIRDVASRAVAHIKRGDSVTVRAAGNARTRGDRAVGADPVLRFLALIGPANPETPSVRPPPPDVPPPPPQPSLSATPRALRS